MAELAELGIGIDPAPAQKGEKAVTDALGRIDKAVDRMGANMDRETRKSKQQFSTMAESVRTAASGMRSAFDGMANAVGIFSPKLGFALQALRGFSAMVGQTAASMKSLSGGAAAAGGGLRGLAAGLSAVAAVAATVTVVIGALLAVVLPLVIAFKALSFAWNMFADGLKSAAAFETYTVRFAGMLGSMDKAEERMRSLAALADKTPFELPEIVQANIKLQSMTDGLWASEKAMIAIGNASARSGIGIDNFADSIGRIFGGIRGGGEWRETAKVLEANGGLMSGTVNKLDAAIKKGSTLAAVWSIIEASMAKAAGNMENLSKTMDGRSSTMGDAFGKLQRVLGEAILPAAKRVVIALTDGLSDAAKKAEGLAPALNRIANQITAVFLVASRPGGIQALMEAAATKFVTIMQNGFAANFKVVDRWVKENFGASLSEQFTAIKNHDIWSSLENVIIPKIGTALGNAIWNAIVGAMERLGGAFAGMIDKATGGKSAENRAANAAYLGKKVDQVGAWWNEPEPLPGVVSTTDQANEVIGAIALQQDNTADLGGTTGMGADLPFNADGTGSYVPPDGATGAELLPDISENTKAVESLTKTIWDVRKQSKAQEKPIVSGGGDVMTVGDSGGMSDALFIQQPVTGENFGAMVEATARDIAAQDEANKKSMTFVQPADNSNAWNEIVPQGGKGGKTDQEKMEAEGRGIMESLRTPMEDMEATKKRLGELKDAGAITAETFSRGIKKADQDYKDAMDSMTEAARKAAEAQMSELQKLMREWGNVKKQVDLVSVGIANSVATNMTSAITGMINGTMSASEAFSKMAASIVQDILEMTTKMLVQLAISRALGWAGGGGGAVGSMVAGVAHEGGIAGYQSESRTVSPGVFRGAERYHTGGTVGLQAGEVPIVANKGETITTEDQERMKQRLRGEKPKASQQIALTNVNVVDATMIDEHIIKNPDAMMNVISRNKARVKQILGVQ